jgi:hypothetical protein
MISNSVVVINISLFSDLEEVSRLIFEHQSIQVMS